MFTLDEACEGYCREAYLDPWDCEEEDEDAEW